MSKMEINIIVKWQQPENDIVTMSRADWIKICEVLKESDIEVVQTWEDGFPIKSETEKERKTL